MSSQSLVACHECDLLQRFQPVAVGHVAKCRRCGAILYRHKPDSINRTLALTIAGLVLFTVANTFPLLAFEMQGQVSRAVLFTGVRELFAQGMPLLAILVFGTTILFPGLLLLGLLYVLLPLKMGKVPWQVGEIFRFVRTLQPWSMMEVFMLGVLVSVVKLGDMAVIHAGLAMWSFAFLILALAGAAAALDARAVWEKVSLHS